jgi:hypothetical protein
MTLGDLEDHQRAAAAAARTRAAIERAFGSADPHHAYTRYPGSSVADAASAFTLPPFQPSPLKDALAAWSGSAASMVRPAGGLAPGARWHRDGVSWTPETALYALVAATNGLPDQAHRLLGWLDAHRTSTGAIPEKVLASGAPASVAPLAWSDACVILAVLALQQGGAAMSPGDAVE